MSLICVVAVHVTLEFTQYHIRNKCWIESNRDKVHLFPESHGTRWNLRNIASVGLEKQMLMISFMFYRCICYLIMCKSTCALPYEQGYFELHSCLIKGDRLLSFHKQPIPCSVVPIRAFKFNHARLHPAIGSRNTCKYNLPDKSLRAMKHLFFLMDLPPPFSDVPFYPKLASEKWW